MTRLLLIHAGPTPWDAENRLTGSHSLPLTPDAQVAAQSLVDAIAVPPTGLYLCRADEACEQVGRMVGKRFGLRLRDRPEFAELKLGLWEGLEREELRRRFSTIFPQWEEQPLSVIPPEGESLQEAIDRVKPALQKILRRNRDGNVAIVLRPLAMQIVSGLLHDEDGAKIAAHLHNIDVMETIELP
jgi:broad specificity phosphatase PhoE